MKRRSSINDLSTEQREILWRDSVRFWFGAVIVMAVFGALLGFMVSQWIGLR